MVAEVQADTINAAENAPAARQKRPSAAMPGFGFKKYGPLNHRW
ncbi:hypothetical protein [Roseitalea porphyridii]|nr:hypothetical protein [Roseitalea porphyridii]